MESRELRIGNLVYNEYTKEVMKVYPMMIVQLSHLEDSNIKGLPLTEEWLLMFGFVECLDNYILDVSQRISLVYFDRNECQFSIIQDVNNEIALKFGAVKYVHQLQNLYFDLTNTELTTKELNQ
jgi:hypothetical protein